MSAYIYELQQLYAQRKSVISNALSKEFKVLHLRPSIDLRPPLKCSNTAFCTRDTKELGLKNFAPNITVKLISA